MVVSIFPLGWPGLVAVSTLTGDARHLLSLKVHIIISCPFSLFIPYPLGLFLSIIFKSLHNIKSQCKQSHSLPLLYILLTNFPLLFGALANISDQNFLPGEDLSYWFFPFLVSGIPVSSLFPS